MGNNQLPLFDRCTKILGEGYRKLAAFKFEEARRHFKDALHSGSKKDKEADGALRACKYWEPLVQGSAGSINSIHKKFRSYDFGPAPGMQQFQHALIEHIVDLMLKTDQFYLEDNKTVSDLLMECYHYEKAEKVIAEEMEAHPTDSQLPYLLAQAQWQNNKSGESKKSFARALLRNPCCVPYERIEYNGLLTLIENEGAEMGPAFGWVRGILPLVLLPEGIKPCSETHQKAVKSYRLLYSADKAVVSRDINACADYRRKLSEHAPDLYDEYFALFTDG